MRAVSETQSGVDRRSFIRGAAAGGLALGVAAAVPISLLSGSSDDGGPEQATNASSLQLSEPMVAYIRDASRGEVVIVVGGQEIVLQDASLAARLGDLAQKNSV
jgi:hypothetical protein